MTRNRNRETETKYRAQLHRNARPFPTGGMIARDINRGRGDRRGRDAQSQRRRHRNAGSDRQGDHRHNDLPGPAGLATDDNPRWRLGDRRRPQVPTM